MKNLISARVQRPFWKVSAAVLALALILVAFFPACRNSGSQGLVKAVILGDGGQVRRLLDGKADPNVLAAVKDKNLQRILIGVTEKDVEDSDALKKAIGVEIIKFYDKVKLSPLMAAAASGNLEIAALLLEAGADVNLANAEGVTALQVAAGHSHREMAKLLREKGASDAGLSPELLKNIEEPPAEEISSEGTPLRVGGEVIPPELMTRVNPFYPETARAARIRGQVILDVTVDQKGNVIDARVVKGLPVGLSESAVEAVLKWKYRPATLRGEPVSVLMTVTIQFPPVD